MSKRSKKSKKSTQNNDRKKTRTDKNYTKKVCSMKFNKIIPLTLLKLFSNRDVAIVNSLSNSIVITDKNNQISQCFGKTFIDKSCSDLSKYKLIVVYCANYTCSASHDYATKLIRKCKSLKNNIVLYEGGINEWALLSLMFPDMFSLYNKNINQPLTNGQIQQQFLEMNHHSETRKNFPFQDIILENQGNQDTFKRFTNQFANSANTNIASGDNSMQNKVCVVTGGTSGLGLEVVKKMLDCGAKHVTLTYYHDKIRAKNIEKMLAERYNKDRFYVLRADARTEKGNRLTFDRRLRKNRLSLDVGPIDCVDINAGVFGPANMHRKHIHNIPVKDYEKTLDTNLTGYFLSMKHFVDQALKNNVVNGSAVCIKSIYGSTGSLFSNTAYQVSKHGVMGLVHQSAIELARPNEGLKIKYPIRVNAVSPTFAETNLTKAFLDKDLIKSTIENANPMGHLAYKNDVAEAVIYLLSDRSRSVTGIDLPVDCGVLSQSIPTYKEVSELNDAGIKELSCCGDKI